MTSCTESPGPGHREIPFNLQKLFGWQLRETLGRGKIQFTALASSLTHIKVSPPTRVQTQGSGNQQAKRPVRLFTSSSVRTGPAAPGTAAESGRVKHGQRGLYGHWQTDHRTSHTRTRGPKHTGRTGRTGRAPGTKACPSRESPEPSLRLIQGAGESSNPEMPTTTDKRAPSSARSVQPGPRNR